MNTEKSNNLLILEWDTQLGMTKYALPEKYALMLISKIIQKVPSITIYANDNRRNNWDDLTILSTPNPTGIQQGKPKNKDQNNTSP